jgi:predicted Zn-dependent protease
MDRAEHDLDRSRFHLHDADLDAYVHDVACRLGGDHCSDIRVYVMRTPYFNASMAPNGMMQVWTGLLLRSQNEAQFAAVLGHEMGHYLERHALQRFRDVKAKSEVAAFLGMSGVGSIAAMGMLASVYAFSRDQERQADAIGLELMTKAGYEPMEASKVWEQMIAELNTIPDRKHGDVFTATHPEPEERLETLRSKAATLGHGELYADRYKSKLSTVRQMLFEDELRLRQYDRSLVVFKFMVDAGGEDAQVAFYTGEVYRLRNAAGDREHAQAAFERSLTYSAPPAEAYRSLGLMQWHDNERHDAIANFEAYLRMRPQASDRAMIQSYLQQAI